MIKDTYLSKEQSMMNCSHHSSNNIRNIRVIFLLSISLLLLLNHLPFADAGSTFDCFNDTQELQEAALVFHNEGCNDSNNCNGTMAQKYGWPIGSWCVSNLTSMYKVFYARSDFNDNINNWDVSRVRNMDQMFRQAISFNRSLSGWNTSSVTTMISMFRDAREFNQDISQWDVSSVERMDGMFSGAAAFNQDVSLWNVSSVRNFHIMFRYAISFNQDISTWDVSAADTLESMFEGAKAFDQDLCAWRRNNKVNYWIDLFGLIVCPSSNLPGEGPFCRFGFGNREELIGAVDRYLQGDCSNIARSGCDPEVQLRSEYGWPIGSWCVSSVKNMSYLFASKASFNEDISEWDVSSVTTMERMFQGAAAFDQDLSMWNVSAVTNMDGIFDGAASLNKTNVCSWSTDWRSRFEALCNSTAPVDGNDDRDHGNGGDMPGDDIDGEDASCEPE